MLRKWIQVGVTAGLMVLLASAAVWAKDPGGYVWFSYRTTTSGGLVETMTTWVIPLPDGTYRVVTKTEQVTSPEEVSVSMLGGSFRWLGLYTSEGADTRLDLAWIYALADDVLEPGKRYMLPDGGVLQTGDRVTVAGVPGIEGTFTHAAARGVTVTVVIADDPALRKLLPFPLRIRIEYAAEKTETPNVREVYQSGAIELVGFTRDPAAGGLP